MAKVEAASERACVWLPILIQAVSVKCGWLASGMDYDTAAMCHNTPASHLVKSQRFDQADDSVKGASGFESSNLLVVFAFKVEIDFGRWGAGAPGCGGDMIESLACQQRSPVYVRLDSIMGKVDVLAGER